MLETLWVVKQPALIECVRELFLEYQQELGIDLCFQGFQEELDSLPGKYAPPNGALLLAVEGEKPVACGALRDLGGGVGEIKRLYVRPSYRGSGLGAEITQALLHKAGVLGFEKIRLDTLRRLASANRLYNRLGFREIQAYNENPEDDVAYFELELNQKAPPFGGAGGSTA